MDTESTHSAMKSVSLGQETFSNVGLIYFNGCVSLAFLKNVFSIALI